MSKVEDTDLLEELRSFLQEGDIIVDTLSGTNISTFNFHTWNFTFTKRSLNLAKIERYLNNFKKGQYVNLTRQREQNLKVFD